MKDTPEKIYAVGDIHGCFDKLRALMDKIDLDPQQDRLVFMGDYIDRGPGSWEVVDYLLSLKRHVKHLTFLKGNHEFMLSQYLEGKERISYMLNGGRETLESYMDRQADSRTSPIPADHIDFFKQLSLYLETDDYIFVHAGLKAKVPLSRQKPEDMLWIRESFINGDYDFGKRVVFGHTPFSKPLVTPTKIGIDTGAVYGGSLTCVKLPDLVFFSV